MRHRRGLTLVEVLLALAIGTTALGWLVGASVQARREARRTVRERGARRVLETALAVGGRSACVAHGSRPLRWHAYTGAVAGHADGPMVTLTAWLADGLGDTLVARRTRWCR